MRVLFIRPRAGFYVSYSPQPPLGPLALASFLQARGHQARIFDHQVERNLWRSVAEFQPDVAAVTLLCESMIPDAMRISRALKARGLPVFWGGHMASAIPEEAARSGCTDYVGISEGEYTLLELLEVVEGKRTPETVRGIAYMDENGEYRRTEDRPFADLSEFPPLDFSLIPVERYFSRYPFANRVFMIMASKGCVFSCTFCFNKEYHRCQRRIYPGEVVFQQIKALAENHHIDGVCFNDELFGADKRELRAFCQSMKNLDLGLTWLAQTGIGILTREDMAMMYDAGCRMLLFGVESGSAEMRKALKKYYDASKLEETFRNCHAAGILTLADIMLGLPDETPGQARETIRLCFRLRPDVISTAFYTPIPGSQLYRALEAAGRLRPRKDLKHVKSQGMEFQRLPQNFSNVPDKELLVIKNFLHWQVMFGKKQKTPGFKRDSLIKLGISNVFACLRCAGLPGLARGLWEAGKLLCTVAWYAHAYPSIRRKYDLYAKNFGRTDWD